MSRRSWARAAGGVAPGWVSKDERLWNVWFYDPPALLVGLPEAIPVRVLASDTLVYRVAAKSGPHRRLMGCSPDRVPDVG